MFATRSPAICTLVASSTSNTRARSRSTQRSVRSPFAGDVASSPTRPGAAIWSAITSSVRSVTKARAASTESPLGRSNAGFSNQTISRLKAARTTEEPATCLRSAALSYPATIATVCTPTPSSSCNVRSIKVHRPTVARQFGPTWFPTFIPLPAARIRARVIMLREARARSEPDLSLPEGDRPARRARPYPAPDCSRLYAGSSGRSLLAAGCRARHGPDGLGAESQLVDGVLRLDEQRLAALVAEDALDGRRHHAVAVRVPKDHHASPDAGVADEVARVGPPHAERGALSAVIANFPGGDADHSRSLITDVSTAVKIRRAT